MVGRGDGLVLDRVAGAARPDAGRVASGSAVLAVAALDHDPGRSGGTRRRRSSRTRRARRSCRPRSGTGEPLIPITMLPLAVVSVTVRVWSAPSGGGLARRAAGGYAGGGRRRRRRGGRGRRPRSPRAAAAGGSTRRAAQRRRGRRRSSRAERRGFMRRPPGHVGSRWHRTGGPRPRITPVTPASRRRRTPSRSAMPPATTMSASWRRTRVSMRSASGSVPPWLRTRRWTPRADQLLDQRIEGRRRAAPPGEGREPVRPRVEADGEPVARDREAAGERVGPLDDRDREHDARGARRRTRAARGRAPPGRPRPGAGRRPGPRRRRRPRGWPAPPAGRRRSRRGAGSARPGRRTARRSGRAGRSARRRPPTRRASRRPASVPPRRRSPG